MVVFTALFMRLIITLLCALFIGAIYSQSVQTVQSMVSSISYEAKSNILAQQAMSLEDRYPEPGVNTVFKENILLTLGYLSGNITNLHTINWDRLHRDFLFEKKLQPGEVFAFHDAVLPAYQGKRLITTNAHFSMDEGFLSDGLPGDGVCHLASLINWTAKDAGLQVEAPRNHDFARIPDVPREYGAAIYTSPKDYAGSAQQNLYVTNNKSKPVKLVFQYSKGSVVVSVLEDEN